MIVRFLRDVKLLPETKEKYFIKQIRGEISLIARENDRERTLDVARSAVRKIWLES